MRVIVVANQKGGVGKTTLAGHLGVMAEQRQDGPVALIDTDPQGSLAAWWNERDSESPVFAQADIPKINNCLVARIAGEAAVLLSQYGTVAPVTLYQRTDFASSMIDGRTVQEINPRGRSTEEVTSLWTYVSTQLSKLPAR